MRGFLFPGQASQFPGMGKDDYEQFASIESLYEQANDILGFRITDVMFEGSEEDLKETAITQPAVFIYSYGKTLLFDEFEPQGAAGHSLGEFTALTAAHALSFEDGLNLVKQRAEAMQKACEMQSSTMAAIVGLDDETIENICAQVDGVVVPANYNCPGQLVISGELAAVEEAMLKLKEAGAKRVIPIQVGGAFHTSLMKPAEEMLKAAIEATTFSQPLFPIYQNVDGKPSTDTEEIKSKLIRQMCAPVYWTNSMQNMIADGFDSFTECGGKVLSGFLRRIDRAVEVDQMA